MRLFKRIAALAVAVCACIGLAACGARQGASTGAQEAMKDAQCRVESDENVPFAIEMKEISASLTMSFAMDAGPDEAQLTALMLEAHIQPGSDWSTQLDGAFEGIIEFDALTGKAGMITETKTVYSIGDMPLVVKSDDERSRVYLFPQVTPKSAAINGEINGKGLGGIATKALIDQFKRQYSDPAQWQGDIRVYISGDRAVLEYETKLGKLQYPAKVRWN